MISIKCNIIVLHQASIYLVMGRTPFFRTSNERENHSFNIKRTQTSSSIGDQTQTPEFWL